MFSLSNTEISILLVIYKKALFSNPFNESLCISDEEITNKAELKQKPFLYTSF